MNTPDMEVGTYPRHTASGQFSSLIQSTSQSWVMKFNTLDNACYTVPKIYTVCMCNIMYYKINIHALCILGSWLYREHAVLSCIINIHSLHVAKSVHVHVSTTVKIFTAMNVSNQYSHMLSVCLLTSNQLQNGQHLLSFLAPAGHFDVHWGNSPYAKHHY